MTTTSTLSRPTRRQCAENIVDAARVIEIATRYPAIEVSALAERFGTSDRTIYNVLKSAGMSRSDDEPATPVRQPAHPWRPAPRRTPTAIAMSKEERQKLIDDFLAKNQVTKIPRGVMTTSDVIFADTIHD
ncbi:hypothetical protein [Devosia salina]|uniref:Uncharacterized protein n=1 Tax=Devosia salina TaxID=2860336 RepID=A0ABX8WCH3_9HYPH|nr:hypothetical protein [Devosia salina]QYO75676.1 hypothetical protein K1X15_13665 [Devosia salina]